MKKILISLFLLFAVMYITGCNVKKYNIKVIENGYTFNDGVLEEYFPYGAYNFNLNQYNTNTNSREDYTFIIKDENQLNELFNEFEDINFDKQMVIVYIYTGIYDSKVKITEVEYEELELNIEFSYKLKKGTGSATMPKQKTLIIIMDKLELIEVDIEED